MSQINHVTKVAYKGGNQEALRVMKNKEGFTSNEWLTFLQAKDKGLKIKKGSKGIRLMTVTSEEVAVEGTKNQIRKMGIYFVVFNLDQTERQNND